MLCLPIGCLADAGPRYPAANDLIGQNPGFMFGLMAVLIPLAIGYEWYVRSKRPKTLDYEVMVSTSLLATASSRIKNELAVLWKGQPVKEPKLIEVIIQNTGKQAVTKNEFDVPLTLTIQDGKLLEASVRRARPIEAASSGELVTSADGTSVSIAPRLLNVNDSFIVQLVVDGFGATVDVTCRFTGQDRAMKEVTLGDPTGRAPWKSTVVIWVAFLTTLILISFGPTPTESIRGSMHPAWGIIQRLVIGLVSGLAAGFFTLMVIVLPESFKTAKALSKLKIDRSDV